jgi:catechol 2,3-dioxygenase-like lactoylglutathione lyase family enzyme
MITGVGLVCVYVLDLDEARDFYVGKLGFEVSLDTVQEDFRWLVIHAPRQPEVPLMLVVPGRPAVDDETAEQIRSLIATGYLGPGALATDDCWATYRELEAKGVEFIEKPEEPVLRHRRRVSRPLRQPLAADPAEAIVRARGRSVEQPGSHCRAATVRGQLRRRGAGPGPMRRS